MSDYIDRLERLNKLKNTGVLTDEEFQRQKEDILRNGEQAAYISSLPRKNKLVALLLAFFLGVVGAHRFYLGYTGIGIAQILTFGGLGVWVLIDIILILTGSLKDSNGQPLEGDF